MISKIKSAKIASLKVCAGILVVSGLVVAFACEQKESPVIDDLSSVKLAKSGESISASAENQPGKENLHSGGKNPGQGLSMVNPQTVNGEEVYSEVDKNSEFPGGNTALTDYFRKAIVYPKAAKENGIQGTVYIKFVVAKDGSIANVEVLSGIEPSLDAEATRVVKSMPKWTPALKSGRQVNVAFTIPIRFALN